MNIPTPETLFIGQHVVLMEQLTSTNDFLKSLLKDGSVNEGFLVVAAEQTSGKGQNGKKWLSQKGKNLLASFLLNPHFLTVDKLHYMVFATALGVRATVQKFLPKKTVTIKWPNDIYVDDAKIAGILIENISRQKKISSITGIGINVNQFMFESSAANATSIFNENHHQKVDVGNVCHVLCHWLEKYYMTLRSPKGMQQIHQLYVSQLYKLQETVYLEQNQVSCVVTGVNENGKLILDCQNEMIELSHNEKIVRWN